MIRRSFAAACGMAWLLSACGQGPVPPPVPPARTLPVIVAQGGAPQTYTAAGSVVSRHRVEVASRLSGYIRELHVDAGDHVRTGQLLARIDAPDVDGAIGQAQAATASADAARQDAQVDVERIEKLFAKGLVSENERRKARLHADAALESFRQASAALGSAQAQRRYAEIRSPLDGVVVERVLRPGDLAVPGAPILRVEAGGDLTFETTVTEKQVATLRAGQAVTVQVDGLGKPLRGLIANIVPSADPVTRSYPVRISLPAASGLMPGMFGRAEIVLGTADTLLLPRDVLVDRAGLTGVFVLDDQGAARFRWLRLGREWPDRVEVVAGLAEGERVVVPGAVVLREGERVVPAGDVR